MNIALLGPSGAGKGTQAAKLCSRFGLRHFSIGDLLRQNLEERTALGLLARKYMDRFELVPDEVVEAMVEERLQTIPPTQGIVLDGYPRTPEQAAFLDELFKQTNRRLDAVIYLKLGEADVLGRLGGRLLCRRCHKPYHTQLRPPIRAGACDVCGGELQPRPDDTVDMARTRLKVYRRRVGPVLEYYQPGGKVHLVDASGSFEKVHTTILELLEAAQRREARAATREDIAVLHPAPPPVAPAGPIPQHALNLVLLGAPGSGKGTQAENLEREFHLCHVASGDLFRENLKTGTPLGRLAKTYMDRGELVPDDITEGMVEDRLARVDKGSGFLLDGFPRTLPQAVALTEMLAKLNRPLARVLYIRVPDAAIVERLSGRWICRACQTPYHLMFKPPAHKGVCDRCGSELYQRDDDKPKTVRARLKTFHMQTEPLIAYYQGTRLLAEVNGDGDVTTVTSRLFPVVRALMG